ncbi:MAG: hypothetical protein ACYS19_17460, partial [Planctomycetota bacterium]
LAKRIARLVDNYQSQFRKGPAILFLEKHGLFITAEEADAALRLVRKVINRCNSKLKRLKTKGTRLKTKPPLARDITAAKSAIRKAFFEATGEYATISYFCDDLWQGS